MNETIPRLTLDTNLLMEYWQEGKTKQATEHLLELRERAQVQLSITARIREDIPREPLSRKIDELPELGIVETGSVTRLGSWVLGRDMLASSEFEAFHPEACELARMRVPKKAPPDWRDWDHLHRHMLEKRDVFLTWDEAILSVAPELKDRFGVVVMSPDAYLGAANLS